MANLISKIKTPNNVTYDIRDNVSTFGGTNLLKNTGFQIQVAQNGGWNTTKNGTLLASSWGGYNSGVTNASSIYHAHLKQFNNEYVYEYIKTDSETWLGISQGAIQTKMIPGETYIFSWEEYHVSGTNRIGTGLYYYLPNATSAAFHLGIDQDADATRELNKWQKYTYTFVAPTNADWTKNMTWYMYGHYNNNGTFYMRHPKLELGNKSTDWTPAPEDLATYNSETITFFQ